MGAPIAMVEATRFGKYTLVAKLAKGGMAEILLARQQGVGGFDKLVVIKRILSDLAEDPQFVSMFLDEARTAARISHPNVCQVFDVGEAEGSYFMAMEYLEGVPLASFRRTDLYPSPPDPQLVIGIAVQMCEGLHHAHQLVGPDGQLLDLVHRDVSGQNLFATADGIVKILDFGIARVHDATMRTSAGVVKGTYAYMAPEQLRNEPIDRRADVFAAGAVVWETLAQRHLFRRDTDFLTFKAITEDPIPDVCELRPDVSPAIGQAIAKALSRDRNERYFTARAFGEALAKAAHSIGGAATVSAISTEIERAFAQQLREQRTLVKFAREGGTHDLRHAQNPALGHGTELATTPASNLKLVLPGPRSDTLPVQNKAPPVRWPVAAGVALALITGGVVWVVTRGEDSEPRADSVETANQVTAPRPPVEQVAERTTPAAAPTPPAREPTVPAAAAPTVPTVPPPREPAVQPARLPPRNVNTRPAKVAAPKTQARVDEPKAPEPAKPRVLTPGWITIDAKPYATIYIDGRLIGETPIVSLKLPPGKHDLKAVSPTGMQRTIAIEIESNKAAPAKRIVW